MSFREQSDAELIVGARRGDPDAYGELYRRHVGSALAAARALSRSRSDADDITSEAFARVLRALQSGGGPEVSFRPYLVTVIRNVFYDRVRRNREEPTEDMSDEVNVALLDAADRQDDGAFAAAAFATLPERWQLVLWHTEVEGHSASEVATILGIAPNAVSALAYRAREGLRQAYLQAHLSKQTAGECRACAVNLGPYVRDGLSTRDRRRVDTHLAGCAACAGLVAELSDTNKTLQAALIPALIGVSSATYLRGLRGRSPASFIRRAKPGQFAAVGAAVAGLVLVALVAGVIGGTDAPARVGGDIVVVDPTDDIGTASPSNTVATTAVSPPVVTTSTAVPSATTPSSSSIAKAPAAGTPTSLLPATTARPATTLPAVTTSTSLPPPPPWEVVAVQRSVALANGQVRIEATVTNNYAVPPNSGIRLDLPALSPLTVVAASGPGWVCTGNVSCSRAALGVGQSSAITLVYDIALSAPPSVTLTLALSAPLGSPVGGTALTVPIGSVPGLLAAETVRGNVLAIGNSVTTCSDLYGACADARDGVGPSLDYHDFAMQYINTAGGVFNSSTATLSLSGTVSRAFLLWGGDVDQGLPAAPNQAARNTVSFGTPTGTTTVTATRLKDNAGASYFAYAEVTALVSASGVYSVADIQTSLGRAGFGGWSLVIIEHNPSLPERLLLVSMPLDVVVGSQTSSFAFDLLDPMVNATGSLFVAGFEGQRPLIGDEVSFSGVSVVNAFSCAVPATRNPAFDNTLGTDVMVIGASGMNGRRLSFTASTSDDRIMVGMVGVALDL